MLLLKKNREQDNPALAVRSGVGAGALGEGYEHFENVGGPFWTRPPVVGSAVGSGCWYPADQSGSWLGAPPSSDDSLYRRRRDGVGPLGLSASALRTYLDPGHYGRRVGVVRKERHLSS